MPAKRVKPRVADARLPHEPSPYQDRESDIIATVASQLAEGKPLSHICKADGMPTPRTIQLWCEANPAFASLIARGRLDGYDALAADCLAIADETSRDTITTVRGEMPDIEWIQRSKLRVETRLKLLAKWDPKRYGDKVGIEHSGGTTDTVTVVMSEERRLDLIQRRRKAMELGAS